MEAARCGMFDAPQQNRLPMSALGQLVGSLMHQGLVYRYRLQSANPDDLRRYAPLIEAQMSKLPILKDVSMDTRLNSDQAMVGVDQQKNLAAVNELSTMTVTFTLAPKVTFPDAIAQIHDMEIRLALPATITASLAKAE